MGKVYDFVDESSVSSWTECQIEFGNPQEHEDSECVLNITQKLVKEHSEEILNVKCLEYSSPSWARSVLSNDQAVKWEKPKVCVYAGSVLCVGQMEDTPAAVEIWRREVEGLKLYSSYQDAVHWKPSYTPLVRVKRVVPTVSVLETSSCGVVKCQQVPAKPRAPRGRSGGRQRHQVLAIHSTSSSHVSSSESPDLRRAVIVEDDRAVFSDICGQSDHKHKL